MLVPHCSLCMQILVQGEGDNVAEKRSRSYHLGLVKRMGFCEESKKSLVSYRRIVL